MSGILDSLGLGPRTPRSLAFRPEPLWIGDAADARRLLAGTFRFAGHEVVTRNLGPWGLTPPTPAFAQALHRFAWLDDFAAAGTREAKRIAQSWTFGWIGQFGDGSGPGWAPEVAGDRVVHWLDRAELILADASPDLERRFLRALAQHEKRLRRTLDQAPQGLPRLRAASGFLHAALAIHEGQGPRRAAAGRLSACAAAAIDADGGVPSRSPEDLADALLVLATALRHLRAAELEPEPALLDAVARAQSALRVLRMRDGGLPRFHGGGPGDPARLDHALSLTQARQAVPRTRDRAMGFFRLAAGRVTVAIDAAPPPPTPQAHASTLAFEFACGPSRLIVNCGPAEALGGRWADACRATSAQTTLSIDGVSSARIAPNAKGAGPHPFRQAPRSVEIGATQDLEGAWFLGEHDGYLASHGLIHGRRLFLSPDGRDFRGEDMLACPDDRARARFDRAVKARRTRDGAAALVAPGLPFSLRFHLHPEVEAEVRPGGSIALRAPESTWLFSTVGPDPELHDSVFLDPAAQEPRATKQIVVSARAAEYAGRVSWGLRRV